MGGQLAELEAFNAVFEHGGFTAAARALELSTGAVTRRVQALEARLGTRLFSRSTRKVVATDAGRQYHAAIAPALAQITGAGERVRDLLEMPRGTLRVSVPMNFGRLYVMPGLPDFLRQWPGIELDAHFDDRLVDVIGDGFDVAVRIGRLDDSRLVARQLAQTRRVLVAAPGYLAQRGVPLHPVDLVDHACLPYTLFRDASAWEFHRDSQTLRVPVRGALKANYGVPLVDAALAGLGILQTATFAVARELAEGRLVEVLPEWSLLPIGVYALFPDRDYRPRKVEVFIDFLRASIGEPAHWERFAGKTAGRG